MKDNPATPPTRYTGKAWRRNVSLSTLVGLSDIARFTGMRSAGAVANWRARSTDFPAERMSDPPRFDLVEVYEWLLLSGSVRREVDPVQPEQWLALLLRSFHGQADVASSRGTAAALVLLQHRLSTGSHRELAMWADLVAAAIDPTSAVDGAAFAGMVRKAAGELEAAHPELHDVLVEPLTVDDETGAYLADLVDALDLAHDLSARERLNLVFGEDSDAKVRPAKSTVRTVAELAAAMGALDGPGTVLDPAVGEASMLVACMRRSRRRLRLLGQEIDPVTWRIARAVLAVRGIDADLARPGLDSLRDDQHRGVRADVVVIDPPFGDDAPPVERWIEYGFEHLAEDGRMVVLLPAHMLADVKSSRRRPNRRLNAFVDLLDSDGLVDAAVVLPRGIRPDVLGPLVLMRLRRIARPDGVHASVLGMMDESGGEFLEQATMPLREWAWADGAPDKPLPNVMLDHRAGPSFTWRIERMVQEVELRSVKSGRRPSARSPLSAKPALEVDSLAAPQPDTTKDLRRRAAEAERKYDSLRRSAEQLLRELSEVQRQTGVDLERMLDWELRAVKDDLR